MNLMKTRDEITRRRVRGDYIMLIPYPAQRRGHAHFDWLDSYHTFSFAEFYDPERMGVSALRVINDDVVQAGRGFGMHPHRDMEILTYVVSGTIAHKDSLGHSYEVPAGEVQRMTAGRGIAHSEFNASTRDELRLMQIWIVPNQTNLTPSYEQRAVPDRAGLSWIATGDHTPDTLHIHQDARIARIQGVESIVLPLSADRAGFLQVIEGSVKVGEQSLQKGDAVAVYEQADPTATFSSDAIALWFDLPGFTH
jgi:redox-sensitive bicupin YhaK (pirin superfamily)